ncbi:spore germination protein [Aneurinibacillus uraniidurans]|uniref:spore germination protein n=1 Tax=Aneurinibacillus uraniidurans TaxID=2966586 RepID=UPI00234C0341|nr:spore germination protein [Aneurinibacillus sp. B1]WCN39520.1 spore germination protein [Aneurinibacillus sp. B1]
MTFFTNWIRGKNSISTQNEATALLHSKIDSSLSVNMQDLTRFFSNMPDLTSHTFLLQTQKKAALFYIDGLVDRNMINKDILPPLLYKKWEQEGPLELTLSMSPIKKMEQWSEIEQNLLGGKSILFIDGCSFAFGFETQNWPQRAIQEPQVESSIKSSHQGFTETASQNISMIRRYIPTRELKVIKCTVGERGKSTVSLLYLQDVVNQDFLQEMQKRIAQIKVDTILNTGELEGFIEDHAYTPFPQFFVTERPDTAASHILQGRIATIVDRSPGVLIGPMSFSAFFQTVDDYNIRWIVASFIRLLRFIGAFIAIFAPAFYIAMVSFHYEIIPLKLLLSIAESRERVPFPPLIEALLMELTLEMLREAGIRLPAPIGQTIGVVGGIVIGQAAVQAGLVSNIMVIVVAVTAIASFIIPNLDMSAGIRILRFPMMVLASIFGMIGIISGMMLLIGHLLSLKSLGSPYMNFLSFSSLSDIKDTFLRVPIWMMKKRPLSIRPKQTNRQGRAQNHKEDP